jgi:hypothetical protein
MAQVLSSDRVGLVVTPDRLQLAPGARASIALQVTNRGPVVDQLFVSVEGIDLTWFSLASGEVSLFPAAEGALAVDIHIPEAGSVTAGSYVVRLTVASRAEPASASVYELPLEVLPVGGLELLLTPQLASVRRQARFQLRLTNTSNTEQLVDLSATDPDAAIDFKLARDRLSLAPGAVDEVELRARPLRRPLITRPRTYTFRVLALPAAGDDLAAAEPLAGADGTLIYRGLFPFLIGLWTKLRGPLLILAVLALLALAGLWALGRAGVQLPFNNPFAQPQPAPTAAPTPAAPPVVAPTVAPPAPPTVAPPPAKPTAPPAPPLAPPTINRFEVTVPSDGTRGQFVLSWDVSGAREVTVAGQTQPPTGTQRIQDLDDSEYVLEATNAGGTVRKSVGIIVLRPPDIQDLSASADSVSSGEPVTLSWKVRRGERADIDGQQVDANSGSLDVRPTATHVYVLTAENEMGRSVKRVAVRVPGSPEDALTGGN